MPKDVYKLQIYCDREIERWLKKRAKLRRCSIADLIRQMVLHEMEKK